MSDTLDDEYPDVVDRLEMEKEELKDKLINCECALQSYKDRNRKLERENEILKDKAKVLALSIVANVKIALMKVFDELQEELR